MAPGDLQSIIERLKMTVPVIRQAKVDKYLRQLVLGTLLKISLAHGELVPAPKGLLFHPLSPAEHDRYLKALGGLTADNQAEVGKQLKKLVPEQ